VYRARTDDGEWIEGDSLVTLVRGLRDVPPDCPLTFDAGGILVTVSMADLTAVSGREIPVSGNVFEASE
jgi:hypothetical protein